MDDAAKLTRAIRINVAGGIAFATLAGLTLLLVAAGLLAVTTQLIAMIAFGFVMAGTMFLTARDMRLDRDDPAGVERRFEKQAINRSAVILVIGLAIVVGVIAWGTLR